MNGVRAARTALITGGGRGIGLAAAAALAEAGFDLAVVSLEPETEVAEALRELREHRGQVHYFAQDIAKIELHGALVEAIRQRIGPIDCLVNNAGVTSRSRGDMLELGPESSPTTYTTALPFAKRMLADLQASFDSCLRACGFDAG